MRSVEVDKKVFIPMSIAESAAIRMQLVIITHFQTIFTDCRRILMQRCVVGSFCPGNNKSIQNQILKSADSI